MLNDLIVNLAKMDQATDLQDVRSSSLFAKNANRIGPIRTHENVGGSFNRAIDQ